MDTTNEYRMEFGVCCIKLEHLRISLQHRVGPLDGGDTNQ
jgi:hypothetical protein